MVQVQLTTDIPSLGSRGNIVITSPGRARNQLVPSGLALYVDRDGRPVSAARDMDAKAKERMEGLLMGWSRTRRDSERDRRAKAVLEGLTGAVVRLLLSFLRLSALDHPPAIPSLRVGRITLPVGDSQAEDPHAPARAADRALAQALSSLPPSLLHFTRLTTSPTSHDLFGSVSISDVLTLLRESPDVAAAAATAGGGGGGLVEGNCYFDEAQDGVVRGRVKQTGTFKFIVELKAIQEKKVLKVEVEREQVAKPAP